MVRKILPIRHSAKVSLSLSLSYISVFMNDHTSLSSSHLYPLLFLYSSHYYFLNRYLSYHAQLTSSQQSVAEHLRPFFSPTNSP